MRVVVLSVDIPPRRVRSTRALVPPGPWGTLRGLGTRLPGSLPDRFAVNARIRAPPNPLSLPFLTLSEVAWGNES